MFSKGMEQYRGRNGYSFSHHYLIWKYIQNSDYRNGKQGSAYSHTHLPGQQLSLFTSKKNQSKNNHVHVAQTPRPQRHKCTHAGHEWQAHLCRELIPSNVGSGAGVTSVSIMSSTYLQQFPAFSGRQK